MKKIKLTQNKYAIVDDEDFEKLNKWKWGFAHGYASGCVPGLKGKRIYMHRLIMGISNKILIDHINKNGLDNRKINLRIANKSINAFNTNLRKTNTSGYKGVSWNKYLRKWEVYIFKNYIKINLGYFFDIKKAILARQNGEKQYYAI